MKEAPEGIVDYSYSGTSTNIIDLNVKRSFVNPVYNPRPYYQPLQITTVGAYEQIGPPVSYEGRQVLSTPLGDNFFIDYTDIYGKKYVNTERLILSESFIETLDLISEGEIQGPVSGQYIYSGSVGQTGWSIAAFSGYQVPTGNDSHGNSWANSRWLRSIYWNEVPVLSDNAQINFQRPTLSFTPGLPNGANIVLDAALISEETTSRTIGERLRAGSAWIKFYRILNRNCNGIILNIKIPALSVTDPNFGYIGRDKIEWNIYYRPLFSNINNQSEFSDATHEVVFGKIMAAGGYVRSTRINFDLTTYFSKTVAISNSSSPNPITNTSTIPVHTSNFLDNPNFIGWEIKIVRTTDDSTTSLKQNATYIDSITELYGNTFTYPNSAIVRSLFDAEYFSSVPDRAFECNLLKVNIPGNYDPILKTYATAGFATTNGYWNGQFATGKAWTDNPAWCFYDLVTNTRYGLGKFIDNINVDIFSLYKIGQYCDELVPNGEGYIEPRFTCNTWIGTREDAFKVVNDFASVFRGMVYYMNGSLFAVQDAPKSVRTTFTNANVENGDFNYSSTSKKTRQSIAIVRYNDPKNFYKPAVEYVEDIDSIRRFGVRELDMTAFACTSRGQAIRLGNWALASNNIETETVEFVAGLEATTLRPGDVFKVFDFNRKTQRYGGRITSIADSGSGATVTLDSTVNLVSGVEYNLSVLTPSYYYESSQITGLTSVDLSDIRRPFLQNFIFSGNAFTAGGTNTVLQLSTGFNTTGYNISGYPIFSIELAPNSATYSGARYFNNPSYDYYRTINIKEIDSNRFDVIGLQYAPQKFTSIDSGITFERVNLGTTSHVPAPPHDLVLNLYNANESNKVIHYAFLVDNYQFISNYKVYVSSGSFGNASPPDDSFNVAILPSDVNQGIYKPFYSGVYNFQVYAYNEIDKIYSAGSANGSINVNKDLLITDVIISSLQLG